MRKLALIVNWKNSNERQWLEQNDKWVIVDIQSWKYEIHLTKIFLILQSKHSFQCNWYSFILQSFILFQHHYIQLTFIWMPNGDRMAPLWLEEMGEAIKTNNSITQLLCMLMMIKLSISLTMRIIVFCRSERMETQKQQFHTMRSLIWLVYLDQTCWLSREMAM